MKKGCKKGISIVLALSTALSVLPATTFAKDNSGGYGSKVQSAAVAAMSEGMGAANGMRKNAVSMSFKAAEETVTAKEPPAYSGKDITDLFSFELYKVEGSNEIKIDAADTYSLENGKDYVLSAKLKGEDDGTYNAVNKIKFNIGSDNKVNFTEGNTDGKTASVSNGVMNVTVPRKEYIIQSYAQNNYSAQIENYKRNGEELEFAKEINRRVKKGDKIEFTINAPSGCKNKTFEIKLAGSLTEFTNYKLTKNNDKVWTVTDLIMPAGNMNFSSAGEVDYVSLKSEVIGGTVEWSTANSKNSPGEVLYTDQVTMKLTPYKDRTLSADGLKDAGVVTQNLIKESEVQDGVYVFYIAGAGLQKSAKDFKKNEDGSYTFTMPLLPATIIALYKCNIPVKFKAQDGGSAVDGVTVKKENTAVKLDSNGIYNITLEQPGEWTYTVSAEGYKDKIVKINAAELADKGLDITVDGKKYKSGDVAPIELERSTVSGKIKITDKDDSGEELTNATTFEVKDKDGKIVDVTDGSKLNDLNWNEEYTLTVTKAADGYKMPEKASVKFSFDRYGKVTVDGNKTSDNIVTAKLEKTAVQIGIVGADGKAMTGVTMQVLDGNTEFVEFVSEVSEKVVKKLVTGRVYTIKVVNTPAGKSVPEDVTVVLGADGAVTNTSTAVYEGNNIKITIFNSIPVDANGNGRIDDGEADAVVGEPKNGVYEDAEGENKKTYLPADVNGDGKTDHYIIKGTITDDDNDGIWKNTNEDEKAFYIPSGYDDNDQPTGFTKIVDSDGDGIYAADDGNGNETDSIKYIPDKDGDGKVEKSTSDGVFNGSSKEEGKAGNQYIPIDKNGDGKKDEFLVDSNGDYIFTEPDANGNEKEELGDEDIRYLLDVDGDGKPEPDSNGDGIFSGTSQGKGFILADDGNLYVDDEPDGIFGYFDPISGSELLDNEELGFKRKYFVPIDKSEPADGVIDGVKEVVKKNDYVYDDNGGTTYIADASGDGLPEVDEDGNGIFKDKDGRKYKENGSKYSSGSGSQHVNEYSVTIKTLGNGNVKSSALVAGKDKTITLTVIPDANNKIVSLNAVKSDGSKIELVDKGNGLYMFVMPESKVTVTAVFGSGVSDSDWDKTYSGCIKDNTCPLYLYNDINAGDWYHDGIHFCLSNNLMTGYGNNIFKPDADITRAMIVVMLWRLEGSPLVDHEIYFEDADDESWYTEAIRWANSEGIVTGYGNGRFGTDDSVTREQMITILWRYAKYKGYDVSAGESADIDSYADAASVAEYAVPAMKWACGSGMVVGKNDSNGNKALDPVSSTTRAQSATMMMRFC